MARILACATYPAPPMPHNTFKGNKAHLPSKPCVACGRAMTWRKAWAKNWAEVKYCSERCRRQGPATHA